MRSYDDLAATALAELDRCRTALRGADWSAPTPCEGWSVLELANHLASFAWQQAEAFDRARVGLTVTPSHVDVAGDAIEVLDVVANKLRVLLPAVGALPGDTLVPIPAGTFPAQIAASILVFEYGIHRNDIERSLGTGDALDVDPVVAATVMELLPLGMLARQAHPAVTPVAYRLVGDSAEAGLGWTGEGWSSEPEALTGACTIGGSDVAVVLAALGRIPVTHPALTVDDPNGIADQFERHFHGL
ncbi:MAG TPA: maleylpyruvate isomerase family mycothiol-dependent enzyme [Acidimicrobiales bacterium]|nr:maleylpyruvate isomerase family mycothiol-dependent enzyme [Acidimicrobiales bacterium]